MATDAVSQSERSSGATASLVAYTNKELEADAERQGKISAGETGELPKESHTGCTLDLSHRKIQALPEEVIFLIKGRVERLALSHNPHITLPSELIQCERLRYLNLRWNQLTQIPEPVLQLSKLEILDISKNKVSVIPDDIKNLVSLKFLAVARNQIKRLPTALGEMASLSKLKFDDNPLEYPPPEILSPASSTTLSSEKEKEVCQQVKRYLKAAAMRKKLQTVSSDDQSESNVETPRPPKRTVTTGRFPVRPSISGIENVDDLKIKSPQIELAPPIPLKSHARDVSGQLTPRRVGTSPRNVVDSDMARNRSDTVSSSASVRSRRQGFVPRKNTDTGSVGQLGSRGSSLNHGSRAMHSRANSSISTLNAFLVANSGGESSSGAVSPVDGPSGRQRTAPRLSSLPETRNSPAKTSRSFKACQRLMAILFDLYRPINNAVLALKDGTPKKTALERQLFAADAIAREIDRLLAKFDTSLEEGTGDERPALRMIISASMNALKSYATLVEELKQLSQKLVLVTEIFHVRSLMNQLYFTTVETRNICTLLGLECKSSVAGDATHAHHKPPGIRSTPPTPASKSVSTRRMRGATILQNLNENTALRSAPPPMPAAMHSAKHIMGSSYHPGMGPFGAENVSNVQTGIQSQRSITTRVVLDDPDNDDQFERIFLRLRGACEAIAQALPSCRREFMIRKERSNNDVQSSAPHHWSVALTRCEAVMVAENHLISRLKVIRLKDPGVRNQKDFWQLCDGLVKAWADFMIALQNLARQRLELTTIKTILRPVQKIMKDTSKLISESPLYHQASRPAGGHSLAPAFLTQPNNSYPHGYAPTSQHGYITPLPATPLSAALGPAVQATVASTPASSHSQHDYLGHPQTGSNMRGAYDRADTAAQGNGYGRR